jgi:hypothetical protein
LNTVARPSSDRFCSGLLYQAAKDATLAACMAQLDQLFAEELVPVSVKAQKRVPVPLELDLMAPIPESVLQFMAEVRAARRCEMALQQRKCLLARSAPLEDVWVPLKGTGLRH